jgi:hypothetical protein
MVLISSGNSCMRWCRRLLPASLLVFTACAAGPQIEVISRDQQILEEVDEAPTQFTVPKQGDREVWNRAHFFFHDYTGGAAKVTSHEITTSAPGSSYHYRVTRSPERNDLIHYEVSCTPVKGDEAYAQRNARNLARFLKDGHLERSLLVN